LFFAYIFLLGRLVGVSTTGKLPRWAKRRMLAEPPPEQAPAETPPQVAQATK
jgi:hypothetical protein